MKKLLIVIFVLVVAALGYWVAVSRKAAGPATAVFDFGDAPSSFAMAKAKQTGAVWLGDGESDEPAQKSDDGDDFDDGVELDVQGQTGTAYFTVHKASVEKGLAYLNLFIDWDKSGKWEGNEWAVKNFLIDLGKQQEEVRLYAVEFPATASLPPREQMFWYRAMVTLDEKQVQDNGGGTFAAGEIEDYGPVKELGKEPPYRLFCSPAVLKLHHGEGGDLSVAGFGFLSLANSVQQKNDDRTITVVPAKPAGTSFIYYKSTHVHPRDPVVELESVPIRVDIYGMSPGVKIASRIKNCPVAVTHEPLEPMRPVLNPPTTVPPAESSPKLTKTPSFDSNYSKEATGNTTFLSVNITPQDLASQKFTKIEIPLQSRNYTLPTPTSVKINLNSGGLYSSDWKCIAGAAVSCEGNTPLVVDKKTVIIMETGTSVSAPPAYISANLYNDSGKKIVGIGIQFKP